MEEEMHVICKRGLPHDCELVWVKEEVLVNEGTNDLKPEIKGKLTSYLEKDHFSSDRYKEDEIREQHEPVPQVWVKQEIKQEPDDPLQNIAEIADEQKLQLDNLPDSSDECMAENENLENGNERKGEEKTGLQDVKSLWKTVLERDQSSSDVQVPLETMKMKDCCRQNMLLGKNCDICKKPSDIHNQIYECKVCGKRFTKKYRLHNHLTLHGDKNFQCDICLKFFVNQRTVQNHKQFVHCNERKFLCPLCGKGFKANYMLRRHTINHSDKSNYACSVCNRLFKRASNLVAHLAFHTGEKKFRCSTCSKRFHLQADLTDHERLHTGEKSYKCKFCEKDFFHRKSVANHERLHTDANPFNCDYCQKQFINRRDFENHVRLHTGEKPYKCDLCKKEFVSRGSLVYHVRVHTG